MPYRAAHAPHGPLEARIEGEDPFELSIDAADHDSVEEVDAVVRGLRRRAIRYAFLLVTAMVAVPILAVLSPPWFAAPIWGGVTLNFLALAVVLPGIFVLIAFIYERFASHVESQMLGRHGERIEDLDA